MSSQITAVYTSEEKISGILEALRNECDNLEEHGFSYEEHPIRAGDVFLINIVASVISSVVAHIICKIIDRCIQTYKKEQSIEIAFTINNKRFQLPQDADSAKIALQELRNDN